MVKSLKSSQDLKAKDLIGKCTDIEKLEAVQ
jgi:hypothetical protein